MIIELEKLDYPRLVAASKNIYIHGTINPSRNYKIEEAIKLIQQDPLNALIKEYLGIKNYAGFGDQDCNCEYGYGPNHGSIVFSIGKVNRISDIKLGEDEIYLLESVRDFGNAEINKLEFRIASTNPYSSATHYNLYEIVDLLQWKVKQVEDLVNIINSKKVEYTLH